MPNVINMPLNEAIYLLENKGLRVKINGEGRIIKQSLVPGQKITKGSIIQLILG